jgi:hypothetical protein
MKDGDISGNAALYGGGVYLNTDSILTKSSGTIIGNVLVQNGQKSLQGKGNSIYWETGPQWRNEYVGVDEKPEDYGFWLNEEEPSAENAYRFEQSDEGIVITGYYGPESELHIPDRLAGLPVTTIGEGAFSENLLKMVHIGANVHIGSDAINNGFHQSYENYSRNAGTYILSDENWILFQPTHTVVDRLTLRSEASTRASAITVLPLAAQVQKLEEGSTVTIDGIRAPWFRVVTSSGETGWVFSGYLKEVD